MEPEGGREVGAVESEGADVPAGGLSVAVEGWTELAFAAVRRTALPAAGADRLTVEPTVDAVVPAVESAGLPGAAAGRAVVGCTVPALPGVEPLAGWATWPEDAVPPEADERDWSQEATEPSRARARPAAVSARQRSGLGTWRLSRAGMRRETVTWRMLAV